MKKPENFFLAAILFLASVVRIWRTDEVLGFYYDQGRDAQVIWDWIRNGEWFLIGPTTGIEGIFRGPWYYWLITPFYWLGGGNPILPAVFLALTTVAALFILFHLAKKIAGKTAGFIAVIVGSFSFFFMLSARWLSNPTPMFLISMLLIYSLFLVLEGKKWAWIAIAFLIGMAMQFGSATEVFLYPAIGIFALSVRKNLPTKKILLISFAAFAITVVPQIVFDIKHNGVLSNAVKEFLSKEETFKSSLWEVAKERGKFYFDMFGSKLFPSTAEYRKWFIYGGLLALFGTFKLWRTNKYLKTVLLVFTSPLVGMLFFQGNHGNVYDYYFTGYYFIFVLIFSSIFAYVSRHPLGKAALAIFLYLFLLNNLPITKNYINDKGEGENTINFGNQMRTLAWVYKDLDGCKDFNQDAYVPPVIPHSYDYLFTWQGHVRNCTPVTAQVDLLYTIYEVDPPHPERLQAWLDRQKGIGIVERSTRFGGITVERRSRISNR
ncbi:MAG: glycosyltransferase family 39 protein [Patescibacteria group bacterium]